eukprot:31269-Pelagococcus_subviridis.AAC.10
MGFYTSSPRLHRESEHGDYAVHRLVLPPHRAAPCAATNERIPERRSERQRGDGDGGIQKRIQNVAAAAARVRRARDERRRRVRDPKRRRTVGLVIPVARRRRVQPRAVLLHDDARHHVLERLLQRGESSQRRLHRAARPLTNLRVRVRRVL